MTNPNYGNDVALLKAAVVTATGTGSVVLDTINKSTLRLQAVAAAVAGTTPSITLKVQTSPDKTTWTDVASFTAITANGTSRKIFTGLDRYCRLAWTVTGTTPTGTLTVDGEAV